ncbi:DUF927 domain-containing protein [Nitrosomonas sp.]|uniref:DUF927 domain-containing protein n=1 Tax=Nitrosomonas sp. TaxID=42353 RepID=UPI001DD62DD5|nr:DUF927 domain-containing protein [Nitrosomonas sp.]MBX3617243.1 DUF927 domain-containing protein [Nitrosomonas sp.]
MDIKVLCDVKRQNNLPGSFKAIEFVDKFGDRKIDLFPTKLLLNIKASKEWLIDRHFELPADKNWNDIIKLLEQKTDKTGEIVDRIGFHGTSYLLPNGKIIGPQKKHTLFLDPEHAAHLPHYGVSGTLQDWKENVAPAAQHSPCIMLAIGNALSGYLLYFVNAESGGFNLFGKSSIGKTTTEKVAISISGPRSNLRSWNFTEAGAEDLAYGHNDSHLALDELKTLDPDSKKAHQKASAFTHVISSGKGKSRSKKYDPNLKNWRVVLLSTGELSLAEFAEKGGSIRMKGEEVRIIDIPADAGEGLGIFKTIPDGYTDASSYVKFLDEATQKYYGTPQIEFLEKLVADHNAQDAERTVSDCIKCYMSEFNNKLNIDSTEGTTNRFGDRFALAYAALCMAVEYEVLPFNNKQIFNRISRCYKAALGIRPKTLEERLNICDRRFVKYLKENEFPALRSKESWTRDEIEQIDGFTLTIKGTKVIALKPKTMMSQVSKSLYKELLKHYQSKGYLLPDSKMTTSTRQISLKGNKIGRYHCFVFPRKTENIEAAKKCIAEFNENPSN